MNRLERKLKKARKELRKFNQLLGRTRMFEHSGKEALHFASRFTLDALSLLDDVQECLEEEETK